MNEIIFVRERDFSLYAIETIREFLNRPHTLLRVSVVGPYFPHRDSTPFVRIVRGRQTVESLMAEISPDQKELRGYFPTDTKVAGRVEFGYASHVVGSIPIKRLEVVKLDAKRIDSKTHRVTKRDLGAFKRQQAPQLLTRR